MGQTAGKKKRVTMADVAEVAGVAVPTVSLVVRKRDYGVSDRTRALVEDAMDQLGYRPNVSARAMRGSTYTLGFVVPEINNPFFSEINEGIEDELSSTDYQVLIGTGGNDVQREERKIEAMLDRQMDGLILVVPFLGQTRLSAIARSAPVVLIGRHSRSRALDSVVDDDAAGAALVVEHLAELGHERIAHISGDTAPRGGSRFAPRPSTIRAEGYERAMESLGLGEQAVVVPGPYTEEGGYLATQKLMNVEPRPTAIFAGSDVTAVGALTALEEAGLRVPEDVSLAGYDNTRLAGLARISLTSVDQPGLTMGAVAARLLIERVEKGRDDPIHTTVSPVLVRRATTGPAPKNAL